jgi:hypothetical protein
MSAYRVDAMTDRQARHTVKACVCAACWSHLVMHPAPGGMLVLCALCKEQTTGYVSKNYTERRKQIAAGEVLIMKHNTQLLDACPWVNPQRGRAASQIMTELFGG